MSTAPRPLAELEKLAVSHYCGHCCANAHRTCGGGQTHLARFIAAEMNGEISTAELTRAYQAAGPGSSAVTPVPVQ